jgi:hypothetical protein
MRPAAALKAELIQKGEASDLFAREHSDGLAAILGNIEQTFGGKALYPSVEERAAALLSFVIKTTRSPTATSASAACCLFISSTRTVACRDIR